MRRPLSYYRGPGLFWFRVFGKGLYIKDSRMLSFSERNGHGLGLFIARLK